MVLDAFVDLLEIAPVSPLFALDFCLLGEWTVSLVEALEGEHLFDLLLDFFFGLDSFFTLSELFFLMTLQSVLHEFFVEHFLEEEVVQDTVEGEDDREGSSDGAKNHCECINFDVLYIHSVVFLEVIMEAYTDVVEESALVEELIDVVEPIPVSGDACLVLIHFIFVVHVEFEIHVDVTATEAKGLSDAIHDGFWWYSNQSLLEIVIIGGLRVIIAQVEVVSPHVQCMFHWLNQIIFIFSEPSVDVMRFEHQMALHVSMLSIPLLIEFT